MDKPESGHIRAPFTFTESEKRILLETARSSIASAFSRPKSGPVQDESLTPIMKELHGVFVTLRIGGHLRGCIGQIVPMEPLFRLVARVAQQSAFDDPRFPPLEEPELAQVRLEITVLSQLWEARNPEEVIAGVHGVLIRRGLRQGVLLPQVATEQGWNRRQFLEATCRKAGLEPKDLKGKDTKILLFTATVFSELSEG